MNSHINLSSKELNTDGKKKLLRQSIKDLKKNISSSQKEAQANRVFEKLEHLPEFINAQTIFIYWSLPDELPTHQFIEKWSFQKKFLLPSIENNEMLLKEFSGANDMKSGLLSIEEPNTLRTYEGVIDLIIVPGLGFDKQKNRLGRGKGFYDKFLKSDTTTKIGIGFDFQILNEVPTSEFDIAMDIIIAPDELIC